jgi:hypothetical protein
MHILPYVRKATAKWVPAFAGTTVLRRVRNPCCHCSAVIPAQAGIHCPSVMHILPYTRKATARWVPAFAGTTVLRRVRNPCCHCSAVIPAKAGIHCPSVVRILPYARRATARWVPAFAGMTGGRIRTDAVTTLPSFQRKLESIARQWCASFRTTGRQRQVGSRLSPGRRADVSEPVPSPPCRHSSASWNPLPVSDVHPSVRQEGNRKMGPSFRRDDG